MTESALADLLAAWLPAQRWFALQRVSVARIDIKSQVTLADPEPQLVHLMVDAWAGQQPVTYQVPVGIRTSLPGTLMAARIGALPDGRIAYDAAADPELTAVLLGGIAAQRAASALRFGTVPGAAIDVSARRAHCLRWRATPAWCLATGPYSRCDGLRRSPSRPGGASCLRSAAQSRGRAARLD
jgi:hypothetical protein